MCVVVLRTHQRRAPSSKLPTRHTCVITHEGHHEMLHNSYYTLSSPNLRDLRAQHGVHEILRLVSSLECCETRPFSDHVRKHDFTQTRMLQ